MYKKIFSGFLAFSVIFLECLRNGLNTPFEGFYNSFFFQMFTNTYLLLEIKIIPEIKQS